MRNVGGGVGGEAAAHGESKIDGQKYEDGICPWFLRFLSSASVSLSQKKELVHNYEASYVSKFLTLI
jgi:hypothetical protein